jgi:hypothetical protein
MKLPGISHALRRLSTTLDKLAIPHMLIGGYALIAYGQFRTTQDIDLAIASSYERSAKLQVQLTKLGFQLGSPNPDVPFFFVTDVKGRLEVEIWTKPDGVVFDTELLRRRVKVRPFDDNFEMFVIGPEDFIVNKLARQDRRVQDETDALSVLARQKGKLDYEYLRKRAKEANVTGLLDTLLEKTGMDSSNPPIKRFTSNSSRKTTKKHWNLRDVRSSPCHTDVQSSSICTIKPTHEDRLGGDERNLITVGRCVRGIASTSK